MQSVQGGLERTHQLASSVQRAGAWSLAADIGQRSSFGRCPVYCSIVFVLEGGCRMPAMRLHSCSASCVDISSRVGRGANRRYESGLWPWCASHQQPC